MPVFSETKSARRSFSFLEALGFSRKALVPKTRRAIPFSVLGRNNYPALSGDSSGFYGGGAPGSTYDYRAAAGELMENSVVAACVDSVGQALADAPPLLERLVGTEWEIVPEHPVLNLLNYPNKYHNPFEIWSAVAGAEMTTGEAFWRLEWNASRTRPTEIWYERPDSMRVIGTDDEYIAKYIFRRDDGAQFELDNSDVIHFRYALNPWNARRGSSPIQSGLRQIAGDNGAATFHGALLRNCAVMSLLVSVKDGQNDNTTPDQLDEFTKKLSQKLRGDNAGAIAGVNLPLDVHKMGYSPDEMALDKLLAYYESRICALLRVDPMVIGLGSGTLQKTYANMGEALNDFWERRILPTKKRHSATLGAQLLPLFGLDPSVYRISWDYQNVAPLQENEDARHVRYREDYRARVIDLYDAQLGLGMNPDHSMRGVFFGDKPDSGGETKSLKIRDANGMWHGDHDGRFQSHTEASGGSSSGSDGPNAGDAGRSNAGAVSSGKLKAGFSPGLPRQVRKILLRNEGLGFVAGGTVSAAARSGDTADLAPYTRVRASGIGAFEAMHRKLYGDIDKIPSDSQELQEAMAQAMGWILPFTSESINREAGVAIIVPYGILGKLTIGESNRINIVRPIGINYCSMHTHPNGTIFSPRDIRNMLLRKHEIQKHVFTDRFTYSLYKPDNWEPFDIDEETIREHIGESRREMVARGVERAVTLTDEAIDFATIGYLARSYNLYFRCGIHNYATKDRSGGANMKCDDLFKDGIGGNHEAIRKLRDLFQAEFDAQRKLHPDREFTSVEIAEMMDRAHAAGDFDTKTKMDPVSYERNRDAHLRLLMEAKAFSDETDSTRSKKL